MEANTLEKKLKPLKFHLALGRNPFSQSNIKQQHLSQGIKMSVWRVIADSHPSKAANREGSFTSNFDTLADHFLPPISPSTGGLPLAAFNLGKVRPYQRGFFCSDDSIRYPFHNSTVTSTVLYSVGLTLPISCVSRSHHRRQHATHCRHHVDLSTAAAIMAGRRWGLDDASYDA